MRRLEGKTAVVTGAGRGLGAAVSRLFAREGAAVVLADVNLADVRDLAEEITAAGGAAAAVRADVTSEPEVESMVNTAVDRYGRVDILINNAGIAGNGSVVELTEAGWDRVMAVNLKGVYLCSRNVIPHMTRAGGGSIVCVSSIAGVVGQKGQAAYHASKHGVIGLVRCMALDHAEAGIRVNAVCPGAVDTPLLAGLTEPQMDDLRAMHPMGRIARPEEVARAVLYLAGGESSFVTGSAFLIDGGYTAM